MRKIKVLIISMIIIIILIIIAILILGNNTENNESDFQITEFEKIDTYETSAEIEKVKNKNKYYAVQRILNTYIRYIKQIKGIIDFQQYDDEEIKEVGVSQVYNILDSEYISKYNLTKSDLQDKIKAYSNYELHIKEMYLYEKTASINIYIVYANIGEDDLNLLIKTDSQNMTFSVFLEDYMIDNGYKPDMYTNNIKISDVNIDKNDDNQYKYVNITDEYMAIQYINSLKYNLLNNAKYVYENLMEDEYKNNRFGNIENFIEYINNNKDEFEEIEAEEFAVNYYDDYTEYVCMDQYENYYIFRENAIMDYTFKLDTYTIPTTKFKEKYNTSEEPYRIQMNIDKFFQMINRHDYKTSYECLAESYKNNYFKTEEEFANFAKNNLFAHNKVTYKNYELKGSGLYVFDVELTDLTGESTDVKKVTIVMQLNDGLDFTMSFSM